MGRREYVFHDEWEVDAPILAVFRTLADATTYPTWWSPVYLSVEADGPLRVGRVARERVKGRLFYELAITSEIVRLEPPREYELVVAGDLSAHGLWTLAPLPGGYVQVRFDWRLDASPAVLRLLAPVLRRWDHRWAIRRAIEGLEPYARASAAVSSSAVSST
jgi:Polyketide cyclase / dehydrase and lipid transport